MAKPRAIDVPTFVLDAACLFGGLTQLLKLEPFDIAGFKGIVARRR
jgi:hypothetical protein